MFNLQEEIQLWLGEIQRKGNSTPDDISELESHLLDQIDDLKKTGLTNEEAFIISIKRLGQVHSIVREYSRNRVQKLWKQLSDQGESPEEKEYRIKNLKYFIFSFAIGIFLSMIPKLFGKSMSEDAETYFFNISFFFILPLGIWYYFKNKVSSDSLKYILPVFLIAFLMNFIHIFYPDYYGSHTHILTMLHLPLSLWLILGAIYTENQWTNPIKQMNFLRFTGEAFIYSTLIGLGVMVTIGLTFGLFSVIKIDMEPFMENWIVPIGFPAVIMMAAFLVEKKKNIVENFAPVLARVFSPIFFITLFIFFLFALGNLNLLFDNRDILILFDLVLVLVLALVIYTISARKEMAPFGFYDYINFSLIIIALLVNALALIGILSRFFEFGITPNRLAALGENILLLLNLGVLGFSYFKFITNKIKFSRIIEIQSKFLPFYFVWLYFVAIGFPFIFKFA